MQRQHFSDFLKAGPGVSPKTAARAFEQTCTSALSLLKPAGDAGTLSSEMTAHYDTVGLPDEETAGGTVEGHFELPTDLSQLPPLESLQAKQLLQLRRQFAFLAHPDRVSKDQRIEANRIMAELNEKIDSELKARRMTRAAQSR